ncbi:hypothetical protein BKA56DRAFT_652038 [Ilyonectria sp. MPI-CAGE-AT-0026]|nr:hypothetical protein BKA56DRAFT_652038 [Ilyonectria sp. MPI-CAGE-AT-0026]
MREITPSYPETSSTSGRQPRIIPGPKDCTVIAYPSVSGVVIGRFTGVELQWLDLPRTSQYLDCQLTIGEDEESFREEDKLALHLLQLGARWWPSRAFKTQHSSLDYPYGYHYPPDLHIGYPSQHSSSSGGDRNPVILFKTFAVNSPMRLPEYDAPEKPEDWSRLAACGTMDERCAVLRDFGATEWDDVKKCSEIPQSLEEGVAEGKKYEVLLNKMKDVEYLDKWLMSL